MISAFATNIKKIRTECNMTQAEFADSLSVTQAAISAYEKGDRSPSYDLLICISEKYNYSIDWLLGFSSHKKNDEKIESYSQFLEKLASLLSTRYLDIEDDHPIFPLNIEDCTQNSNTLDFGTTDTKVIKFLIEWNKMHNLLLSNTIDEDLYMLWLNKELKKYDEPLVECPFM